MNFYNHHAMLQFYMPGGREVMLSGLARVRSTRASITLPGLGTLHRAFDHRLKLELQTRACIGFCNL